MERMSDGFTAEQEARVVRASVEGPEMEWTKTATGWQVTTKSGGCYTVGEDGSCSCPDAQYRLKGTARCKHAVSLGHRLLAERPAFTPAEPRRRSQEEEDATFDRIFGE